MSDDQLAALEEQKQNCIFCKIIKGEIPSFKCYDDEDFFAIMDIRPAAKGHVLLMPKEHYPILPVIPQDKLLNLFPVIKKLSRAVKTACLTNHSTIFFANGGAAGQMSPHFILHIIPRENNDMLPLDIVKLAGSEEEVASITKALQSRFKPAVQPPPKNIADRDPIADLAEALQENPEVKQLIIEDPEKFKNYVKANPQLEGLFSQIDINKLSEQLKSMEAEQSIEQKPEEVISDNEVKEPVEEVAPTKPEVKEEVKSEIIDEVKEEIPVEKKEEKKEEKKGGADLDKISNLFK